MEASTFPETTGQRQYRVYAKSTDWFHVDLLAADEAAALELAEQLDGGEFDPGSNDDWSIEHAKEIPLGEPFVPVNGVESQSV